MPDPTYLTISDAATSEALFTCQLNPSEYSIKRTACFRPQGGVSRNADSSFTSANPDELSFSIILDNTYRGGTPDIRPLVTSLRSCITVTADGTGAPGEPPVLLIQWGDGEPFRGQMSSLDIKFTLFLADGTPIRGTAGMAFKSKLAENKAQNPTSHAIPGYKRRTLQPGETLCLIAFQELGDAGAWRRIADANTLLDPLALRPGMQLHIPVR